MDTRVRPWFQLSVRGAPRYHGRGGGSLIPDDLDVKEQGDLLVCQIRTGRSRNADESVGFFLMPLVVASVLPTSAYGLVYLGVAVAGWDPAIVLHPWRSAFTALAVGAWLVSTGWMWMQTPRSSPLAELKFDSDSLTLIGGRGAGFHVLYAQIRDAMVVQDKVLTLKLNCEDGPQSIPMGGHHTPSGEWLAMQVRERAAAARQ